MASETIGTPVECNIERRRGDTRDLRIRLIDKDTSNPIDVTGYSALLSIDVTKDPSDNLAQVFQASGVPTGTPTDGILVFDFSSFDSGGDDVQPGKYFYDVQTTDAATKRNTPLVGKFTVVQDITKAGG